MPRYYKEKAFTEDQRQKLWIYTEESGIKYVNGFKVTIKTEEDLHYYDRLREQRRQEVESMYKNSIQELLEKRLSNRVNSRSKYAEKLKKYYGKELRQRQRADKDLCRDLNQYADYYFRGIEGNMVCQEMSEQLP